MAVEVTRTAFPAASVSQYYSNVIYHFEWPSSMETLHAALLDSTKSLYKVKCYSAVM